LIVWKYKVWTWFALAAQKAVFFWGGGGSEHTWCGQNVETTENCHPFL
jgi:hypothetical protein